METSDRLRLFCALDLPESVLEPVVAWQQRELRAVAEAGGGRIVPPENLHLTLAFLGSQPASGLPAIVAALRGAIRDDELCLRLRGYRETRSVGMLTFDDEDGRAGRLAARLHEALEELGVYERESRPWLPHLTVLRFRERPRLQPPLPELGEVGPSDAAVFISRLRPGGAVYEAVEMISLDNAVR